jgi:ABC-type sugar transport system permease subunit
MAIDNSRMKMERAFMVSPGVLIYLLFMALPIILTSYYGFTDWDGIKKSFNIIGLKNFIKAFSDEHFLYTIRFTMFYTIVVTVLSNGLGLLFAILLNKKAGPLTIYRSILFLPLLISPIAAGFIWKALFSYTGIVNVLMEKWFNAEPVLFLGNTPLTKTTLIGFSLWQNIGFCMVIYLAGLQTIPSDLYDSAAIDGAGTWKQFWFLTFPFLAPATTTCVTFMLTGCMREYPRVLVYTAGGPVGKTETAAYHIVKVGFDSNRLGYASAMAVLLLILAAVISILVMRFLRKREDFLL